MTAPIWCSAFKYMETLSFSVISRRTSTRVALARRNPDRTARFAAHPSDIKHHPRLSQEENLNHAACRGSSKFSGPDPSSTPLSTYSICLCKALCRVLPQWPPQNESRAGVGPHYRSCEICLLAIWHRKQSHHRKTEGERLLGTKGCDHLLDGQTRWTSRVTMRACSAGNNSSHSGSSCIRASRTSASAKSPSRVRDAFQVPATISGWRNTARSWAMTAASISPAGTRPTIHDPAPCLSTVWLT